MSEKVFPKPKSSGSYREPSTPSAPATEGNPSHTALKIEAPKRTVVTRADPPPEIVDENSSLAKAKLSPEEVRALLAVNASAHRTQTRNRLILAAFPTFFISLLADKLFGWWGIPITLACGVLWALWPMRKQDREGW